LKLSRRDDLLTLTVEYGVESVFANLRIALQIMLTMAVSIASCERSFSKLKLITDAFKHPSLNQSDKLCDLAWMNIERNETKKADFDESTRKVLF